MFSFICDRLWLFLFLYISLNFTTILSLFSPCCFLLYFFFFFPPFLFSLYFFPCFPLPLPFVIFLLLLCLLYSAFFVFPSYFLSSWISAISFTVFSACQKGKPHWATLFFPSKGQDIFLIINEFSQNHRIV